ncbi:Rv2175c family DNA-binding protein [Angustibacter speluncae]
MSEDGSRDGGRDGSRDEGGDSALRAVDELVGRWLTVPDVAEVLGCDVTRVRSLLDDRQLVAVRRGRPRVLSVPAALVEPEPLPGLAGTLTVLSDTGHDDLEALRWLFTPEETLGESPVAHLRAGHKAQVRRLAQALAF